MENHAASKALILIVEDDTPLAGMLQLHLESHGYRVICAPDGERGLSLLSSVSPDLIVMDVHMPKKDGWEFYKEISTAHGNTRFPVLVMSGHAEFGEVFRDVRADGFIAKPFEMSYFLAEVERILSRKSIKHILFLDLLRNRAASDMASALELERYKVTFADHLQDVQAVVPTNPPDFIVMEYLQEEMRGDEMIREVKKLLPGIPVLVYSLSGQDFQEKSLRAGADRYLGKLEKSGDIVTLIRSFEIPEQGR